MYPSNKRTVPPRSTKNYLKLKKTFGIVLGGHSNVINPVRPAFFLEGRIRCQIMIIYQQLNRRIYKYIQTLTADQDTHPLNPFPDPTL